MKETEKKVPAKKTSSKEPKKTSKKAPEKVSEPKKTAKKTPSKESQSKKAGTKSTAAKTASSKPEAKAKTSGTVKKTASRTSASGTKTAKAKERPVERSASNAAAVEKASMFFDHKVNTPFQTVSADAEKQPVDRKKFYIGIGIVLLLLLLILLLKPAFGGGNKKAGKERQNTISLAEKYMDRGQYDQAMDLLNKLLIQNADDEDAIALLDKIIALKKEQDERDSVRNSYSENNSSSYNISVDTDGLTSAFQSGIDSMRSEIERNAEANARNQEALNALLEQQRRSSEALLAEEQARREEKKAQEALQKQEEEKRRVQEEELARKNKNLQNKIGKINEQIQAGKADLNTGNIDRAIKNFKGASDMLPIEEGEPAFSASKYSEIANVLYQASLDAKTPGDAAKLNDAAVNYVNLALSKDPGDPVSHYILGMNAFNARDYEKAQKEFEDAVKGDPNNYMYYYNLGRVQYRLSKYSAARSSFESAIKCNRNFDSAYFNLGMTLRRLGQTETDRNRQAKFYQDALQAFRTTRQVNTQNAKAYLEEARLIKNEFNSPDKSIEAYNHVITLEPMNIQALSECGLAYSAVRDYKRAEECFRKAVALISPDKPDPLTYYNLALCLYNQGKLNDAERYAKNAYDTKDVIKNNKEKAKIVYNYALIKDENGDGDNAIILYKEVLKLDPDNAKTKTNLGVMFLSMNETDAALSLFLDAYKVDSGSFELNNNIGNAYLKKKEYDSSIKYLQTALKINPADNSVRQNLAQAFAESGSYDNAKTTYIELIKSTPDNYDAYVELAKVCIASGDMEAAEGYLVTVQTKAPAFRKKEVESLLSTVRM